MTTMGNIDVLLQQLKSENLQDQIEAIRTLRSKKTKDPRVVEALIEALQNPENDPFVREDAAEALGEIGNPMAIQPLIEAFRDLNEDNSYVWLKAACALLRIGGPEVLVHLLQALQNEDPCIRVAAAHTLGQIKDRRAVEPLIALLQDQDPDVRFTAAQALESIKDRRALRPLVKTLRDENPEVRRQAVWALGAIGDKRAFWPLSWALKKGKFRAEAARALSFVGDLRAVPLLINLLEDKDLSVRENVAWSLGKLKDRRAVEPLIKVLNEQENQDVRKRAAWALGEIGDPRATRALVRALVSKDSVLRRFAAEALEKIGGPQAEEALLAALERGDLHSIAGAYRFFLQKGLPGSEKILLEVLHKFGDKTMAKAFLSSGNPELEKGARKWAQRFCRILLCPHPQESETNP